MSARRLAPVAAAALWSASPFALADFSDWPASVELSFERDPAHADTRLNPDGRIVDTPDPSTRAALRLQPKLDGGDVSLRADLWAEWREEDSISDGGRVFAQEAMLDLRFSPAVTVSGGVAPFRWGTAYVWNPSNPFPDEQRNFTDRARTWRAPGTPQLGLEWTGSADTIGVYGVSYRPTTALYGRPIDLDREPAVAVRWRHQFEAADLTLTFATPEREPFFGAALSATVSDQLELHAEAGVRGKRQTLLPVARDIPGPGGTVPLYTLERDDDAGRSLQWLVGGQYTTEGLTNVIVEFYRNGEGYSDREYDHLLDYADDATARLDDPLFGSAYAGYLAGANALTGMMRRNYGFVRLSRDRAIGDFDLRGYWRYGFDDGSSLGGVALIHPLGDSARVRANLEVYGGRADSETRLIPSRGSAVIALEMLF
ncbi:MAG TPA: hypothetical protein PLP08_14715 [Plasticicumulans sp.]|uniref:hypothetical protein n=2 Tax=Plasticicumulans sp. TaxID=2307179 RepID=UPI002B55C133|nr:hypothetical protein [Plasticicumulans sp.]HMV40484.1 hypothetical protein [Plasticicumulans sp.]HMW30846.1 hypothetical protein [Plasticicumulans sp.]HMX53403.1 hypothetical protein [Plasticicumulans sp.]HMZ10796.1 hypothetical protein [Plasticicumulans sp.]HNF66998.1 hypothetical protein [Plasticicumulans sp.]